jgi:phosphoribosylamine--glycine ligase
VLPLLATPLAGVLHAVATGRLADAPPLQWRDAAAVTVVLASAGYPGTPRTGDAITGVEDAERVPGVTVVHAGTAHGPDGTLVTAGGRVLAVTAVGADVAAARRAAYDGVARIHFAGAQHRTDIASEGTGPTS